MLDKKDLIDYMYQLISVNNYNESDILLELENTGISKLDVNRFSRYLESVYQVTIPSL